MLAKLYGGSTPFAYVAAGFVLTQFLTTSSVAAACYATNQITGEEERARVISGPSFAWAHASWDNNGRPTITLGPMYYRLPPLMQRFTRLHECGHLSEETIDEIEANCYALENGDWSEAEVRRIGDFHRSVGPVGLQYGGTGAEFWERTLEKCPEFSDE